jgi:hypothetical protein
MTALTAQTLGARLHLRREVFELGLLPLAPLLPRLDSPAALQARAWRARGAAAARRPRGALQLARAAARDQAACCGARGCACVRDAPRNPAPAPR